MDVTVTMACFCIEKGGIFESHTPPPSSTRYGMKKMWFVPPDGTDAIHEARSWVFVRVEKLG